MKGKITKMSPEELGGMKFKDIKTILKKDLAVLQEQGTVGASFYVVTEFNFEDKEGAPLLVIGELKGEWKKYAKENVKPPHKNTAVGTCIISQDGTTLTMNIEKGKAKPKAIEKALIKGALSIIPSTITNVIFNETPKLEADDEIDAADDEAENVTLAVQEYAEVLTETKLYKAIAADDFKARLKKIKDIDKLIAKWEKKNLPVTGNSQKESSYATLQKLRAQLYSHRIDINIQNRKGPDPIDSLVKTFEAYKKRPLVEGLQALSDSEDRLDSITDLQEEILGWYQRNSAPYSKKEEAVKLELDKLAKEVNTESLRIRAMLPQQRKDHAKAMLEMLSFADDKKKNELAEDPDFILDMMRNIPVEHINIARKFLGMEPVKEESSKDRKPKEAGHEWNDPEVLAAFKKFEKVVKFSEDVIHRDNPEIEEIKVVFPAGAQIQEDGGNVVTLNEEFTFELISEDNNGIMKLDDGNGNIYFADRDDLTSKTDHKKTKATLFTKTPSVNDVKQGGLGDCYLLAAVASLTAKDPSAIEDMMLDKVNSVTVRLFHVAVNAKGEKEFNARYFNIEKSFAVDEEGNELFANDSLWVQMLEKAYAAGKFAGSYSDYKANLTETGKYTEIEGGNSAFAYEVLTGRPASLLVYHASSPEDFAVTAIGNIKRGEHRNNMLSAVNLPWGTNEKYGYSSAKTLEDYKALATYEILGKDLAKTKKWFQFVAKKSIHNLFKREYSKDYSGETTLEDFELLFQGKMKDSSENEISVLPVLDAGIATLILDWMKKEKLYPGKRGTGIYSALQLNLFNEVKTALDNDELVSLGSKTNVGRSSDGVGHSGGESMSGGLVGGHVYTALNYREPDPQKELLMRNPWARTVQENIKVSNLLIEVQDELRELVKKESEDLTEDLKALKIVLEELKKDHDNEKDPTDKENLKKEFQKKKIDYDAMKLALDNIKTQSIAGLGGKLYFYQDEYDSLLKNIVALRKKDPNALISKQVEKSKEAGTEDGEFWMLLDDVTLRFDEIYIG